MKSSTEVTVSGHEGDQIRQGEVSPKRAVVEAALVDGHRRIFGFLLGRLRNADEAKDVMQEFALRAIRRAEELRDVQSVRGWLSRLLATAISDHHRRFNRRRNLELPAGETVEDPDLAAGPDVETDAAVCKCLRELIGLLPSGPSDLLRRIDLDQQSRPDVASALNITEATLAVRLHRARAKAARASGQNVSHLSRARVFRLRLRSGAKAQAGFWKTDPVIDDVMFAAAARPYSGASPQQDGLPQDQPMIMEIQNDDPETSIASGTKARRGRLLCAAQRC